MTHGLGSIARTALRTCVALCALSLAACDNLLGLHDIQPDGAPVALALTVAGTGVAQQPLAPIAVTALDVRGMPVANYAGMVTLTLGNRAGGGSLIGTLTAPVTDGQASFDLVGIDRPGAGYTLVASSGILPPVTSDPIAIAAPRFAPVATGIPGGPITSLAISPSAPGGPPTVFAGAADGVYKSVDRGASWKLANFGGDGSGRLVADRDHPGVVYLLHDFGGFAIKRTADGGATWHDLRPPPASAFIATFAVDPRNSSVIYAAGPRLLRSDDGGATWTDGVQDCYRIAVDPIAPDTVYCVTFNANPQLPTIYKTSNAGATWTTPSNGLPSGSIGMLVAAPTGVFVAVNSAVYRSIDGGASWTNVSSSGNALAYAPSRPDRIYVATAGGIAVSNDGGASFGLPVSAGDVIQDLAVDPTNPDVVYAAGSTTGVLVSTNGGTSWKVSSNGLDAHPIGSVTVAPTAPATALITTGAGVLRTINGGASWTTISQVHGLVAFDPAATTRVYLCGLGYFATSSDSGESFTGRMAPSLDGMCGRIVAAGGTLYTAASGRVYRSNDGGASWAKVDPSSDLVVTDIALGDATGDAVVATTQYGVYHSSNGGASFTQVATSTGLNYFGYHIVADRAVPTRVIASTCPGFQISTDGGATFGKATGGLCVSHLTSAGGALYAAGFRLDGPGNLWTSTTGGSSWTLIETSGVPSRTVITSIAASDDGTIYLGTPAGLYTNVGSHGVVR